MSYPPLSNFVKETLFSPWCQSGRWSTQKALNKSTFLKRYNLCDDRTLLEIRFIPQAQTTEASFPEIYITIPGRCMSVQQ